MYRIAIVDDERIVKLAVQSMIDWAPLPGGGEGLELAGTASDGREALELATREKVDIVITDLKMAGMDGLELLAELRRLASPPEVIVLSNFGDFGYVREALKGGALDYILKTDISPEKIMASVREAVGRLDARHRGGGRPGAFLVEAEGGVEGLKAALGSGLGDDPGSRALVMALALDADSDRPPDGALRALVPQCLKGASRCAIASAEGGQLLLMPMFPEASTFDPRAAAAWLADQARLYYGLHLGLALSASFSGEAGLEEACLRSRRASELFFYSANAGKVLEAENRQPPAAALLDEIERSLPGPGLPAGEALRLLRAALSRAADLDLPPGFIKAAVSRSLSASIKASSAAEAAAAIESATSDALLLEAYAAAIEEGCGRSGGPGAKRAEIRTVLEIIEGDISARVSVPALAEAAGLSESYLCTVFKSQTGKSIVGYLNDRRLDRANDLLGTGRYLVKEAAAEVGFDDPFYFNRLFKRRFGVSPSSVIPP